MEQLKQDMQAGIVALMEAVKNDYLAMHERWNKADAETCSAEELEARIAVRKEMAAEFVAGVRADIGKKYVKIVREGSVHSFVMMEDDSKFRRGDILRAAFWAAPARNSARGNVLTGDLSRVSWTGVI